MAIKQDTVKRHNPRVLVDAGQPYVKVVHAADYDALRAELLELARVGKAAHASMFEQCFSNPIKNAWGQEVNCTAINELGELAGRYVN